MSIAIKTRPAHHNRPVRVLVSPEQSYRAKSAIRPSTFSVSLLGAVAFWLVAHSNPWMVLVFALPAVIGARRHGLAMGVGLSVLVAVLAVGLGSQSLVMGSVILAALCAVVYIADGSVKEERECLVVPFREFRAVELQYGVAARHSAMRHMKSVVRELGHQTGIKASFGSQSVILVLPKQAEECQLLIECAERKFMRAMAADGFPCEFAFDSRQLRAVRSWAYLG